jgi:transcriptional regulator with XRE-family HTH domain
MNRLKEILDSQKKEKPRLGKFLRYLRLKFSLTQEEISKKIEVSRPTLNKIEADKAEITLVQAKKLADFYNITLIDLINCEDKLGQNLRLLFKESKEGTKEEEIILSGKRYNIVQELILYLLDEMGGSSVFNELVLSQVLFLVELEYLRKFQLPLIGLPFVKNNYGPTPLGLDKILEDMQKEKLIEKIHSENFRFPMQKFLPLKKAELKNFRADEIKLIDVIIYTYKSFSINDLRDCIGKIEQYKNTEEFKKIELY